MAALLDACLSNLKRHALPVEIDEISDRLSDESKEILVRLASSIRDSSTEAPDSE
jgi:hypothetical protein